MKSEMSTWTGDVLKERLHALRVPHQQFARFDGAGQSTVMAWLATKEPGKIPKHAQNAVEQLEQNPLLKGQLRSGNRRFGQTLEQFEAERFEDEFLTGIEAAIALRKSIQALADRGVIGETAAAQMEESLSASVQRTSRTRLDKAMRTIGPDLTRELRQVVSEAFPSTKVAAPAGVAPTKEKVTSIG